MSSSLSEGRFLIEALKESKRVVKPDGRFVWSFLPGRIGMQHIYMILFMFPGAQYSFRMNPSNVLGEWTWNLDLADYQQNSILRSQNKLI